MYLCRRFTDTQASIIPLMTHGKAFNGTIRMPNSAMLVNTYSYSNYYVLILLSVKYQSAPIKQQLKQSIRAAATTDFLCNFFQLHSRLGRGHRSELC